MALLLVEPQLFIGTAVALQRVGIAHPQINARGPKYHAIGHLGAAEIFAVAIVDGRWTQRISPLARQNGEMLIADRRITRAHAQEGFLHRHGWRNHLFDAQVAILRPDHVNTRPRAIIDAAVQILALLVGDRLASEFGCGCRCRRDDLIGRGRDIGGKLALLDRDDLLVLPGENGRGETDQHHRKNKKPAH